MVGLAPGVDLHNLKVLSDSGRADVSSAMAAMEYVIEQKEANMSRPAVVNMSLGEHIGTTDYTALDQAIVEAVQAGITVVVAAGNQGFLADEVTPAHTNEAITVGAFGIDAVFSSYSNYGQKVDLLAPGDDVISLTPTEDGVGITTKMSGTSMATAHVAGAAALYLAQNPDATPIAVKDAILASAKADIVGVPQGTGSRRLWVGLEGETVP